MFLLRRGKSKPKKTNGINSKSAPVTPQFAISAVATDAGHEVLTNGPKVEGFQVGLVGREAALEAELAEMREESDAMRAKMRSLALERDAGLRDAHAKEREVLDAKRYVNALKDQLAAAENQRDMYRRDADDVRHRVALLEEQVQMAEELLKVKDGAIVENQRNHARTLALLQTKAVELEAAQAFVDTSRMDAVSEDDVTRGIHDLNAKISDTAVVLAGALQYESKHRTPDEEKTPAEKAVTRVKEMLGPSMVKRLRECPDREDAALVIQIAFQGCMVLHCAWIIAAWHFDFDLPKELRLLQDMLDHVRQSEPQAVSGKWRSVTRKHIQSMRHGESYDSVKSSLVTYLVKRLVDALLVAGCNASKEPQVHDMIMNVYGDRLDSLIHVALGLNRVVGIDALSCDYEPVWTRPDVPFNPVWMEDIDGQLGVDNLVRDEPTIVRVLCTTSLGLRKKVKGAARQRRRSRNELRSLLVLKPKVALESSLYKLRRLEVRNSLPGSGASVLGSEGSAT
ncbi:hypothetical protein OE88DRAFT_192677 [Heliocybe sulcata]|uniref:Uncharacterized protein n=1 Tax=Heliocybe sulcata TaxID=5364 RepID=A0A5C3N1I9_9AGAM|nr:hypothetical protein OE88DRAFT_192677 [Heliocybe sulcata]